MDVLQKLRAATVLAVLPFMIGACTGPQVAHEKYKSGQVELSEEAGQKHHASANKNEVWSELKSLKENQGTEAAQALYYLVKEELNDGQKLGPDDFGDEVRQTLERGEVYLETEADHAYYNLLKEKTIIDLLDLLYMVIKLEADTYNELNDFENWLAARETAFMQSYADVAGEQPPQDILRTLPRDTQEAYEIAQGKLEFKREQVMDYYFNRILIEPLPY